MTKKPNLLKTMLATASTVAVLVGGADAFAVDRNITGNADTTGVANVAPVGAINNDDNLIFGANSAFDFLLPKTGITIDNTGAHVVDLNVAAGGTGSSVASITGVVNSLDIAVAEFTLDVKTNTTITASTIAAGGKYTITGKDATYTGTINGANPNEGTLVIAGQGLTFASNQGAANSLNTLSLANNAGTNTFSGTMTTGTGVTVDGTGETVFVGALTSGGAVTYNAAGTVTTKANSTTNVAFGTHDGVYKLSNAAGGQTLTGNITATNVGTVISENAAGTNIIAGNIGADANNRLKTLKQSGAGRLKVVGNLYATTTVLDDASATLELDHQAGNRTVVTDIVATNPTNTNMLVITEAGGANGVSYKGKIGSSNVALGSGVLLSSADAKLTLEDTSEIYADVKANADGQGILELKGDIALRGVGLPNPKLKNVLLSVADKTVTFTKDVYSSKLQFSANATAVVKDGVNINVVTSGINNSVAAGTGNLTFEGASKVSGVIGSGAALKTVNLNGNGKKVEVTGNAVTTQTLAFNGETELLLSNAAGVNTITSTTGITVATNNTGKITSNNSLTLATAAIGEEGKVLREVHITADNTITLNQANTKAYANFTTYENNKGTVDLTVGAHTIGGDIGTAQKRFNIVNAGVGDEVFKGNVYAKTFNNTTGGAGRNITFEKILSGDVFDGTNAGGHAHATTLIGGADGAVLDTVVKGANMTVKMTDNGSILKDIGVAGTSVAGVTFTDNKTVNIAGVKVYTAAFTPAKSTVNFTGAAELYTGAAAIDLSGTTLRLNANTVKSDSTAVWTVDAATKVIVTRDEANGSIGLLNNTGVAKQDFTKATLHVESGIYKSGEALTIFKGAAAPTKFGAVTDDDRYYKFANAVSGNDIILTPTKELTVQDDVKAFAANSTVIEVAEGLDRNMEKATGSAANFFKALKKTKSGAEAADLINTVTPNGSVENTTAGSASSLAAGANDAAINNVSARAAGISSGEGSMALGAWAKGLFAKATQKANGNAAGYKSDMVGATVGFDMAANDATVVGAAVSYANTDAKYKGFKAGNKSEAKSMIFNVYGVYDFGNDVFAQAGVSFGNTKVKDKVQKATNGTATGKYDVMNYGLSALAGYNYKLSEGVVATPMAGLSYSKYLSGGYTETGAADGFNVRYSKKNTDKLIGTLGLRLAGQVDAGADMKLTPEAHGFIKYDFRNKAQKQEFTIDGLGETLSVKSKKPAAATYNLGLSLTAKSGNIEYGAGYDAELRTKYAAHQGSLKVRVNF